MKNASCFVDFGRKAERAVNATKVCIEKKKMAPEMDKIKGSGEGNGHMIILAILLGKMPKYEK